MRLASVLLLTSLAAYAACLPLDTFCVERSCSNWPGYGILLIGAIGMLADPANLVWLANPLLFLAWVAILTRWRWIAVLASIGAAALALGFLAVRHVVTNEGGLAQPVTGYALGYWLWLASTGLAVAAAAALSISPPREVKP